MNIREAEILNQFCTLLVLLQMKMTTECGGYIIIGIEEESGMPKLPLKGLNKSSIDRINKELLQKRNLIELRYILIVEQASYEGKDIIVLWIPCALTDL